MRSSSAMTSQFSVSHLYLAYKEHILNLISTEPALSVGDLETDEMLLVAADVIKTCVDLLCQDTGQTPDEIKTYMENRSASLESRHRCRRKE